MINVEEMRAKLANEKEMVFKSPSAEAGFNQLREQDALSAEFAEEVACRIQEKIYESGSNEVTRSSLYDMYSTVAAYKEADLHKVTAALATYWGIKVPVRTA